jgi:hypothetical protein
MKRNISLADRLEKWQVIYSRWGKGTPPVVPNRAHANLRLRKKLVFFDNSGNRHFAVCYPVLHTNYPTLALHSDAFGQRDLRGQSQGEGNGGALGYGGVQVKTNASRTYVADLSCLGFRGVLPLADGNRYAKREAPCSPLLLGFCHLILQKRESSTCP